MYFPASKIERDNAVRSILHLPLLPVPEQVPVNKLTPEQEDAEFNELMRLSHKGTTCRLSPSAAEYLHWKLCAGHPQYRVSQRFQNEHSDAVYEELYDDAEY